MFSLVTIGIVLMAMTQDPLFIKRPSKLKNIQLIVEYAEKNNQDPYELVAIAVTESGLNSRAVSWAGAIGLFQVMCKYWHGPLKYKTIKQCEKALFDPRTNIKAGVHVLTTYRNKYKQCKGDLAYRCYYAGQGWNRRKGRLKQKIAKYEKKVVEKRKMVHKYYSDLIETIRSELKSRS
jgi:soluble lytic murein transglycosylase-like protein